MSGTVHTWIHAYLTNRSSFVKIDSASSSCDISSTGVPQGSVLGPLLFVLFISPVVDVIGLIRRMNPCSDMVCGYVSLQMDACWFFRVLLLCDVTISFHLVPSSYRLPISLLNHTCCPISSIYVTQLVTPRYSLPHHVTPYTSILPYFVPPDTSYPILLLTTHDTPSHYHTMCATNLVNPMIHAAQHDNILSDFVTYPTKHATSSRFPRCILSGLISIRYILPSFFTTRYTIFGHFRTLRCMLLY